MNNSEFVTINDSKIHYIDEGIGEPIVFLHGVPTSSYLWRNIIPNLSDKARCIALDLVGMGKSDKPNIQYSFFDHVEYFDEFISKLGLTNVTLVLHGLLGSAIGFNYAMRHSDNLKGMAFYEAYVHPSTDKKMLSLPVQCLLNPILQDPEAGYKHIVEENFLIDKLLPNTALHSLTDEAIDNYRQPFINVADRKPLWQCIQDFFMGENHQQVMECVTAYSKHLQESPTPKLMLYAVPGFVTNMDSVKWCQDNLSNLQVVDLDEGLYLAPESNPQMFGQLLRDWYLDL